MQKLYEAMFIIDSNRAKESYEAMEELVKGMVVRYGGEVVGCMKWDDRRLAYEISDIKRGTYVLVHFKSEGDTVGKIERQVQISEDVLRVLITVDEDGIETTTGSARERTETPVGEEVV